MDLFRLHAKIRKSGAFGKTYEPNICFYEKFAKSLSIVVCLLTAASAPMMILKVFRTENSETVEPASPLQLPKVFEMKRYIGILMRNL